MPERVIDIYLGEHPVHVGTAFFHGNGARLRTTFTYATSWLSAVDSFALAPSVPLSASSVQCASLPGFLSDAAPDRWGRHLIFRGVQNVAETSSGAMRSLDDVDYLLGVDDWARMGALRLSREGGETFLGMGTDVPKIVRLPELLGAVRSVDIGSDGWQQVKTLLDAGSSSLGGARPKATVEDDGLLWLAKFPSLRDEWDVMAWEAWAVEMAGRCGVRVPHHRTLRVGDHTVFLSQRFDRQPGSRVPYLSALAALDMPDGAVADYLDLADVLQSISDSPSDDLVELFRRMVFSIAIHNTDDHLRNHGLLRVSRGWRLSPAFDLNPNPFSNEERALLIMGTGNIADETKALVSFAEAVGLSRQLSQSIVREVLAQMRGWQVVAKRLGCPQREVSLFAPIIQKCCDALAEHSA